MVKAFGQGRLYSIKSIQHPASAYNNSLDYRFVDELVDGRMQVTWSLDWTGLQRKFNHKIMQLRYA